MDKKLIISTSDGMILKLNLLAKEKEDVRRKLAVTAEQLRLKAQELAVIAKEKEDVRRKLAVTAEQLKRSRKMLEEKVLERTKDLEQVKAKDEAMLLSIGDGLLATDIQGKIVLVNKAFETMLGWKESEVIGKLFSEIVDMTDESGKTILESESTINKILKKHTKTKTTTTTTTTTIYKRKNGTFFPVVITTSPILIESEFVGVVEVFRDITKEKDIDKAKTEFVSLASHQLRTPLSTVNWYTEMLLGGNVGKVTSKQQKYLEEIYTGNQRMVELVNALLDVSRLELGTFLIDPEPTDIVKLAQSETDEQKPQINEKKLKLNEKYADNLPKLNADPKLLRIMLQNLLSNAVKYTPEGGKIEISFSLDDPPSHKATDGQSKKNILLKISDTGCGIPKNQQDKIFIKLFRADNVRENDTDGTGLGLYIAKSIIEHSGGKIWFSSPGESALGGESSKNPGTTFYVTLPLSGMKKKEGTKALE